MITGLGAYLGRGGLSDSRAREYAKAGIKRVILCAEAVDGWTATETQAKTWGASCRLAAGRGSEIAAYTFPGTARTRSPESIVSQLFRVLRAAGGTIPVLDVEAPYKNRGELFVKLADAAWLTATPVERANLVITTLGTPSRPGNVPWASIVSWVRAHPGVSIGLQVYETAADDRKVDARILEVRAAIGSELVFPCVATYERDADPNREGRDGPRRMLADLDRACFVNGAPVSGCDLWSGASLDASELAALPSYVRNMGWT